MEIRKNSARFFCNRDCEYYPCHEGAEEINCLFCYCPLFECCSCPGTPEYIETAQGRIKDCSHCIYPHVPEHYDGIMACLAERSRKGME